MDEGKYRKYVRSFMGVSLTIVVCILAFTGKVEADAFLAVFATVTGFYFGSKKIT